MLPELEARLGRAEGREGAPLDFQASLTDHSEELFRRLRLVAFSIAVTSLIVALFPQSYLKGDFSMNDYEPAIYLELKWIIDWSTSQIPDRYDVRIVLGSPITVLVAYFELALIIGIILNIPFISYQMYEFLRPALYDEEAVLARRISLAFGLLFFFGATMGFLLIPPMMRALVGISGTLDVDRLLIWFSLDELITYIFFSVLVAGIVHTYPVFLILLVLNGVLTSEDLRTRRREVFAGLLCLTAVITPDPTPFSMIVLSIPLVFLYEITINVAMKVERSELYAALMERYGKTVANRTRFEPVGT